MSTIDYQEIFEYFLGGVTDYGLAAADVSDSLAVCTEYLHKVMAEPYVSRLFSARTLDDEVQQLSVTMAEPSESDDGDREFVIVMLGKWMVYEWLHHEVRSKVNIQQVFTGKDAKYYSQAAHIAELRSLMEDALKEARFFVQNRGLFLNDYLGGAT